MKTTKMQLYESLKAIFLHIDDHEKHFLAQYGLNVPRFYILLHVGANPGINYIDLSEKMLCTKSNTTRIVRGMQRDGLIARQSHPEDGRSYQLFLTPAGGALLGRAYPAYERMVEALMASFSEDEISRFTCDSSHIESTLAGQLYWRACGGATSDQRSPSQPAGIAPYIDGKLASQVQTFQRRNQ